MILLDLLKKYNNKCPVLYTSSIQADNGTKYGESKIAAERALIEYGKETGNRIVIYRLTGIVIHIILAEDLLFVAVKRRNEAGIALI